jgi:hypothetical protein
VLWDPAFHRALGRRGVDVSFLGRPALLCPVTSPATAPRVRGLSGATLSPLIVLFLLAALAALRGQTTFATSWPRLDRPLVKSPPSLLYASPPPYLSLLPEHLQGLALPLVTIDQDQDRDVPAVPVIVVHVVAVALLRPSSATLAFIFSPLFSASSDEPPLWFRLV